VGTEFSPQLGVGNYLDGIVVEVRMGSRPQFES
jgi:hypothetical protein